MSAESVPDDFPEVQAAIYGVALSMDSFLLNGIPYGIVHRQIFEGFAKKTADNLLNELATLEDLILDSSKVADVGILERLKKKCHELIDAVSSLESFKTLPLEQVRSMVSRIPLFREECVQLIQQLEACLQTPKPFYQTRPKHSSEGVSGFLDNLDRLFTDAWTSESLNASKLAKDERLEMSVQ